MLFAMFAPRIASAQTKEAATSHSKAAPQQQKTFGKEPNTAEHLRMLQHTIGNEATMRLLKQVRNDTGNESDGRGPAPGPSWDFSKIPIFPPTQANRQKQRLPVTAALQGIIQPKLEIGAVNDPLEREADRVAEQVMRMPDPSISTAARGGQVLQRKCAECKEEEEEQHKLSRKESGGAAALDGTAAPPIVHEVLRSPGQPLDAATLAHFE